MANRTDPSARTVHGTNPQSLVEKIVRAKIYETVYWKEHCFALTAESIIDKAVELKCLGGTFGGQKKPTNFMCLVLKMLQIQPEKEIIVEFIKNEDFKYVRLLGAFYLRLVGRPLEVYQYLEPLYNDYRKIRLQTPDGHYVLSHVDEAIDDMLRKDYLFDIALPRIPSRMTLERGGALDVRLSVLDEEFDEAIIELEAGQAAQRAKELAAAIPVAHPSGHDRPSRPRSRSPPRPDYPSDRGRDHRHRSTSRDRDRGRTDRDRRSRSPGARRRDRSRSPADHRRADRSPGRARDRDRERDRDRKRDDRDGGGRRGRDDHEDPEVAEANAMRAKLGLRPLK